jgi:phage-related protein
VNIIFDDIDLASYGIAVTGLNARSMATVQSSKSPILGRDIQAELVMTRDPGTTEISGMLSADTDNWSNYTHANWLSRRDAVVAAINPNKGYRRLALVDQQDRYRWCRFLSMLLSEQKPVWKLPFQAIGITFENLEPYWRKAAADAVVTLVGTSVPNTGNHDSRPRIDFLIGSQIVAPAKSQPITLAVVDDIQIGWSGSFADDGVLNSGDFLTIDSETCTAVQVQAGVAAATDVTRWYESAGPGAYAGDGFPLVRRGGSAVSYIHPRVASMTFKYDLLLD